MCSDNHPGFRAADMALLRAAAHSWPDLPWPDLADSPPGIAADGVDWLRRVWADEDIGEALEHASPALAGQVRALLASEVPGARHTRRVVLSVARYLLRMSGRATPFGLMAGVAAISLGCDPHLRWGDRHRAFARADADWLARVIARLDNCAELAPLLPVVGNSTLVVRGNRLIVPYQPDVRRPGLGAAEISLRYTAAVRAAVDAAREPIRLGDLGAKMQAAFPAAAPATVSGMLTDLITRRVLITSLHAPSTEPDALDYLVRQLDAAGGASVAAAADLVTAIREIHSLMAAHNKAAGRGDRAARSDLAARMRRLSRTRRHPLALDLRLDVTAALPDEVAREAERAALALTRLAAYPAGTPAWKSYHQRFYERFGLGAMVPLLDVVADSGIGWPDGYPGTATPPPGSPISGRDKTLLALAQAAAIGGSDEVVLDEPLIKALELGSGQLRPPPHLELGIRVIASGQEALRRGEFRLEVTNVSRAAGVLTGRFLGILQPGDRAALAGILAGLPGCDHETAPAQLSFPPLDPATAHVTRTVRTLPVVISLAEHRAPGAGVLTPADLAVGCDGRRMYLAAPGRQQRVEAVGMHALNLITHTPPLARLLTELSRAQCAQVTTFDWGAAACLPFLPRLRYGRTILSPATWRLEAPELPGRGIPWPAWNEALTAWMTRKRVPSRVHLREGDQFLPLDLDRAAHRQLLRAHLDSASSAVLTEAPGPEDMDWCGGRPHEVIITLTARQPPAWPSLPRPSQARVVSRDHGQAPGASAVLLASLYGDIHRQDTILAEHLPCLLSMFREPTLWWYIRYRDPGQHLRLRVILPGPDAFGDTARTVSTWADGLRRAGLLRELAYPTSYPETGRWGSGQAWTAAQQVFAADSRALLTQLRLPARPHRQALAAAHAVAIAAAFTGSPERGMRWLLGHVPAASPARIPRQVFSEAVRVCDPGGDWAALRAVPGGTEITDAWKPRDQALAAYRAHLPGPDAVGIAIDDVLSSLLHTNFVRAHGIDFGEEAIGMRLARAAALTWTARTRGTGP